MNCPRCGGILKVTHSYAIDGGRTQRRECVTCHLVVTTQTVMVYVDPGYGQGAAALARKLNGQKSSGSSSGSSAPRAAQN